MLPPAKTTRKPRMAKPSPPGIVWKARFRMTLNPRRGARHPKLIEVNRDQHKSVNHSDNSQELAPLIHLVELLRYRALLRHSTARGAQMQGVVFILCDAPAIH